MRIGFIAMSGVRAANPELTKAGLTFPGVLERSRVIASLPSLGLLTLAGLTPDEHDVSYHEILDLRAEPEDLSSLPHDFDLVAISSYSAQIKDAYAVADAYRARGAKVVLGGLHVTALPDEAAAHADAVVVGEAEPIWRMLLADAASGRLAARYEAGPEASFDLANAPMPRYELLEVEKYNRLTVQTSRGCPHRCDFCASSILLTDRYKVKPVERIIDEVRRIKSIWPQPFIEFADDNSFVHRRHARELMAALRVEDVVWFTEADVSIASDPALLRMMREAGCRQVLIGLESPTASGLDGVERRRNWKLRQLDQYEQAVRVIQSCGVTVNGCFILGLDGDDEGVFDRVHDFVERTNLYEAQVTVLTPFPGTPLYARLLAEGRILSPGAWERCTLFDVNFEPRGMSAERLQRGLLELAGRLYDPDAVWDRRRRFFRGLDRGTRGSAPGLTGLAS